VEPARLADVVGDRGKRTEMLGGVPGDSILKYDAAGRERQI
jgi:hypothetical protein